MSRRPARFTKTEISNAINAAVEAGVQARVEVDKDGKIVVFIGGQIKTDTVNEWDADGST